MDKLLNKFKKIKDKVKSKGSSSLEEDLIRRQLEEEVSKSGAARGGANRSSA